MSPPALMASSSTPMPPEPATVLPALLFWLTWVLRGKGVKEWWGQLSLPLILEANSLIPSPPGLALVCCSGEAQRLLFQVL